MAVVDFSPLKLYVCNYYLMLELMKISHGPPIMMHVCRSWSNHYQVTPLLGCEMYGGTKNMATSLLQPRTSPSWALTENFVYMPHLFSPLCMQKFCYLGSHIHTRVEKDTLIMFASRYLQISAEILSQQQGNWHRDAIPAETILMAWWLWLFWVYPNLNARLSSQQGFRG